VTLCRIHEEAVGVMNIAVNAHAPIQCSSDDRKSKYHKEMQRSFNKCPKYDVKNLLGEFS
jgi:hypothetical protein